MPDQTSGLTPTSEDMAWYKRATDKPGIWLDDLKETTTGLVSGAIQEGAGRLKDFAVDLVKDNLDHPGVQVVSDLLGGVSDLDYMVTEGAKLTPGGQGEVAKQSLEIAELATGLAPLAKTAAKQAPAVIQSAAKAGVKDLQNLGVGQPTLAAIQEGLDNLKLPPPSNLQPAFAGNVGNFPSPGGIDLKSLDETIAQPLKVASNMEVSGWEKSAKTLIKEGAEPEQIKRVLARPYHKDLHKSQYEYVSLDDIAKDKDGWLTVLIDRAEQLGVDMAQYHKLKKQKKNASNWQREMYDRFMDNPLDTQGQMYNPNNPVRKAVAKTFTAVLGKEWHHIFGNKEGAESIMSIVAQDPYIAANLFSHMKKIGLSSSGKADNIALMKMKAHRGRGDSYHAWARALGLEGRGKRADAVISEYMQEISRSILAGETDVKELFSMLSLYKKVIDGSIKPKIKALGGEFADEMTGVGAFALGKTKRQPLVKPSSKAR